MGVSSLGGNIGVQRFVIFCIIDVANQYRYHTRELILVTSLEKVVNEHLPRIDPF